MILTASACLFVADAHGTTDPALGSPVIVPSASTGPLQALRTAPATDLRAPLPRLWAANFGEFDEEDRDVVSAGRAFGYSLILPGAGQWYLGERRRAAYLLTTDAVAWTLWGYFRKVGSLKEDDHYAYAAEHAGVDPAGKDDEFYRTITFHDSRDEFNGDRSGFQPAFPTTETWNWQWDSPASKQEYREIRNQSKTAYNRARFALGALFLNRMAAALDAWRTAKGVNRRARMEVGQWKVRMKGRPSLTQPRLTVTLSKRF